MPARTRSPWASRSGGAGRGTGGRAQALASRLAELPPQTLAANKHCINVAARGGENGFEAELAASALLLAAPETQRRVTAFLQGK